MDWSSATTEARNPASAGLDQLTPLEIVRLMNAEDARVIAAVGSQEDPIARAIECIAERMRAGGRLVYAGAGTSGRLGVLDASECPPTFNTEPGQVIGLIAGGPPALTRAIEGAEDDPAAAIADLQATGFSAGDTLVGIASSGSTPYVVSAMRHARSLGAMTIGLSCNDGSPLAETADILIAPVVGPEILTGSTRLKAGTATKLVLNTISTGVMVRLGKTFGNLMVDLQTRNQKLVRRAKRIVGELTGLDEEQAAGLLERAGGDLRTAVVMQLRNVDRAEAREMLRKAGNRLREALESPAGGPSGRQVVLPGSVESGADPHSGLVLAVDGGGSKTLAWIVSCKGDRLEQPAGKGHSGPSNPLAAGWDAALENLRAAVGIACQNAGIAAAEIDAACLAVAGAARSAVAGRLKGWAEGTLGLRNVQVVSDAEALLGAGGVAPDASSVALICGTGSVAFARRPDGSLTRAGGWGSLIGDDGSGFSIGRAALRAVAWSIDAGESPGSLTEFLASANGLGDSRELVALASGPAARSWIADQARHVIEAARQGDLLAGQLIEQAAGALAHQIGQVLKAAGHRPGDGRSVRIAATGGVICNSPQLRDSLLRLLQRAGWELAAIDSVADPVSCAAIVAARALRGFSDRGVGPAE